MLIKPALCMVVTSLLDRITFLEETIQSLDRQNSYANIIGSKIISIDDFGEGGTSFKLHKRF